MIRPWTPKPLNRQTPTPQTPYTLAPLRHESITIKNTCPHPKLAKPSKSHNSEMINAPRLRLKVSGRPLKGPPLNLQPQPSAKNAVAQQATHSPSPSHFDIQLFNFFNFSDDQISTFELLNFSGNKKSTFELFQLFQLFQCCNFNIWTFWIFERFQMLYL